MAHETHNDANSERNKSIVSFKSSFWLVVILVGLFVAALNFINVMKSEEGHEGKAEATEMHGEKAHEAKHEGAAEEHGGQPAQAATTEGEAAKEAKTENKDQPKAEAGKETAPEHK